MTVTISNNIQIQNPSAEKTYVVYRHIFPNGKSYIGITSAHPYYKRWKHGEGYRNQIKVYRAIKKFGWGSISHEIIANNLTLDDANLMEQELIAKYDSINNGYNITTGGGGCNGFHHSDEAKRKISIANKGIPHGGGDSSRLIKWVSVHGAWNKGKKLSPEHYRKLLALAKSKGKPITAYNPITHEPLLHFESCEAASRAMRVSASSIRKCLKGRTKTSVGYIWRYDNESI